MNYKDFNVLKWLFGDFNSAFTVLVLPCMQNKYLWDWFIPPNACSSPRVNDLALKLLFHSSVGVLLIFGVQNSIKSLSKKAVYENFIRYNTCQHTSLTSALHEIMCPEKMSSRVNTHFFQFEP